MPAYNAEKYIRESICSILSQTYSNWELIVIDDGSTDRTSSLVKEFQLTDNRIIYYLQKHKGLGAARNSGLNIASGEWIMFLDSDDLWVEEKLSKQMQTAVENDADFIFSQGYYSYEKTNEQKPYDSLVGFFNGPGIFPLLLMHNYIPVLSVCFKKKLIKDIGLQDTQPIVHGCEDWDYWLRISQSHFAFIGLKERLFQYRVHSASISVNSTHMRAAGVYVAAKNFNPKLLNDSEQKEIKTRLFLSIPFIVKNLLSARKITLICNYLSLLLKIITVSITIIPFLAKKHITKSKRGSLVSL